MVNASNAVVAADKSGVKTGTDKAGEKVIEKRRALGRGLDSLLAGPRVVAPVAVAQPSPSATPTASSSSAAAASSLSLAETPDGASVAPLGASGPATVGEIRASGETADGELVYLISLDLIDENPYQTRRVFDEEALGELADSIRAQGLLQPIVVRPGKESGRFTLILGERRLRATRLAGLETIPVIVRRVSEQQAAEMTIVENLQRQELNCIEQADAFAKLSTNFLLTQQQIGDRVGLSRAAVSNYMRLLTLGDGIVSALQKGQLTFSHARLLLMVQNPEHRWKLAEKAIAEKMSVFKLETLVMGSETPAASEEGKAHAGGARWVDPNVKAAQRSIEEILGMRVRIRDRQGRGRIVIDYNTIEDFDRVVGMLRGRS